jgi:ABC-2 type transport system ATP-binding protein
MPVRVSARNPGALMPAVVVENLVKTYRTPVRKAEGVVAALRGLFRPEYKDVHAVAGVSFTVEAGEMVAFLGPNGAGKTTTLKMLSGLIFPTAGKAAVLGFTPWDRANAYRRQFALVMGQKNQLWWDLPARESFRLHREIYEISDADFRRIHDELVALLKIGDLVGRPVRELSLGERMKMELVAALLHSPRVLFLDEPTIGLDVVAQSQLRDFLMEYNRKYEVTTLLTSHYMKDVEHLCERAIVINHGKVVCDERLDDLTQRLATHKILKVQFADEPPADLSKFGAELDRRGPIVRLKVDRARAPAALAGLLGAHQIDDVTVEEVPLEEVIANVFRSADAT